MASMRYPLTRKAAMDRKSNGVRVGTVVALGLLGAVVGAASRRHLDVAAQVSVKLSEWNVGLSQASIAAGPGTFLVTNTGGIPHGFAGEGQRDDAPRGGERRGGGGAFGLCGGGQGCRGGVGGRRGRVRQQGRGPLQARPGPRADEGRPPPPALRRRDQGPVLPRRDSGTHAARAHDQQCRGAVGVWTSL